jgi:hypothetical protein
MMMRYYIFCMFFVFSFAVSQNSNSVKNNFEILKELYSKISSEIVPVIPQEVKSINLRISGDENNQVAENFLREILGSNYIPSIDSLSICEIIDNTKIQYSELQSNSDKFVRDVKCLVSVKVNIKGMIKSKNIIKNYSDTLDISDLQSIEYSKIYVNKENFKNKNIFDTLFQPVIILTGLGLLVYLLFSIRSN